MQTQIQALIVRRAGQRIERVNIGSHIEVAKSPVFNRKAGIVEGFIIACRLYLRIKMRETMIEKQIQ